ncbi:hypothetical protein [Spirosoma aerolatum]|uniref:hypothetical protein n=1 Tax=Spirosoma aerolatum TaxID=1211326 RepID=UPI0012D2BF6D|nr:hypothetical protein [Spirosoma aerolatum]
MKSIITLLLFGLLACTMATNPPETYARPQTIRPGARGVPNGPSVVSIDSQPGFQIVAMNSVDTIRPRNGVFFTPDELESIARSSLRFTGSAVPQINNQINFTSQTTMDAQERDFKLGIANPFTFFGNGNDSFAVPDASARTFSFRITNTTPQNGTARTLTAVLFGGYRALITNAVPGLLKTGTFNDKAGNAGLSAASTETQSIEDLHAMILREPTELLGILFRYENNSASQISSKVTFSRISPYSGEEAVIVSVQPQISQDPANPNDKILPLSLRGQGIVLGYDKNVEYPILADTSVVVTLFLGGSFSEMKAMEKFTKDGQSLVKLIGQSNLIAAQNAANVLG